jgi:exodeoxyribonuclease V alpha subunit
MVAMTGPSPAPSPPRPATVLEAVLERFIYLNEDTGCTIARVATDRTGLDLLTVAGRCWAPRSGKVCG